MTFVTVPKGWRRGQLQDLVFFQRGFDITKSEQRPGPIPVISSSGVTSFHDEAMATGPGIVIGRKGTIGSIHFTDVDYWPHDTTLWSKELRGNNARFVYYFLHTIDFKRFDVGNSNPTLNRNHIHDHEALIPPLPAQACIAGVLSAYDELISNNCRRLVLLADAASLVYQEWFVRLRFPGREHTRIIDGVPKGWARRMLGDCSVFLSGGTPSKARADFWEGDIPWVSSGELTALRIDDASLHVTEEGVEAGSRLVPANTILAVVRGMSLAKEFRLAITSRAVCFNQDLKAIVANEGVDPNFLFHSLVAQRDTIRDRAGEAAHGTKKLDTPVLASTPILLPPVSLQRAFSEFVSPMNAQWDNLNRQITRLRAARDLLLPRLMSGELSLRGVHDESYRSEATRVPQEVAAVRHPHLPAHL